MKVEHCGPGTRMDPCPFKTGDLIAWLDRDGNCGTDIELAVGSIRTIQLKRQWREEILVFLLFSFFFSISTHHLELLVEIGKDPKKLFPS